MQETEDKMNIKSKKDTCSIYNHIEKLNNQKIYIGLGVKEDPRPIYIIQLTRKAIKNAACKNIK